MKKKRLAVVAALATTTALLLTACSGGSTGSDEAAKSSGDGLTKVTVGVLPIAPSAVVQMGIDEGIFEKNGLEVELQSGQGGTALLPAVSSGSMEFAVGNELAVLLAASQGIDMRIVTGFSSNVQSPDDPEDQAPSAVVVKSHSGIESWKDLEGKTVAVNVFKGLGDLSIMAQVEADGGDPSKINFTEIGFPDQTAQLESGHIDAAWIPEPFLSGAKATEGIEQLGDPLRIIDNLNTMVTFTSGKFADEHPDVVKAFAKSITESADLAMSDTDAFRAAIVDFTGMDAAVVDKVNLEYMSGDVNREMLEQLNDLAVKYGVIEEAPDLDKVIFK